MNTAFPTFVLQPIPLEMWPDRLRDLLNSSPIVSDIQIQQGKQNTNGDIDGSAIFRVGDELHYLLVECKPSGQPRHMRLAALHLDQNINRSSSAMRGIVVAPFISSTSRAILAENGMGWLDFAGNTRIIFPRFHLEIDKTDHDPFSRKREQRSLFFPKSAWLLKFLLHSPRSVWKVTDLVLQTGVSAGQVSKIRRALIDREWAVPEVGGGFRLTNPEALLDAWHYEGQRPTELLMLGHTLKHGAALEEAIVSAFSDAANSGARLLLAGHSVARRVAPFARVAGEFFYADAAGLELLEHHLQITPTMRGENVSIYGASNDTFWLENMDLGFNLKATGVIQTYLDLLGSGERGAEAAEHWRAEQITPLLTIEP